MMKCPTCRKRPHDNQCGFLVFLKAECPVCLSEKTPMVALPCGHALCKADFRKIGGVIQKNASENKPPMVTASVQENQLGGGDRHRQRHHTPENFTASDPSVLIGLMFLFLFLSLLDFEVIVVIPLIILILLSPNATDGDGTIVNVAVTSPSSLSHVSGEADFVQAGRESPSSEVELSLPARNVRLHRMEPSAWIFCPTPGDDAGDTWDLWHANHHRKRHMHQYPNSSKLAGDGRGGIWALCPTAGEGWRLRHTDADGRELYLYEYPRCSQLIGDERGGLWVLCTTNGNNSGESKSCLWHVTEDREINKYEYPKRSQLVGDGCGGVWILCPTSEYSARGEWRLRHANEHCERDLYQYPKDSKLAGDGRGGIWILCPAEGTEQADGDTWRLWYANVDGQERNLHEYPRDSQLVGDGVGGVWVISPNDPGQLWHVTEHRRLMTNVDPAGSKLVGDGCGGVWVLCQVSGRSTDVETGWRLWHLDDHERNMQEYPRNSIFVPP